MATSTPTTYTELRGSSAAERFRELVEHIHTVMLLTSGLDGRLDGRPMGAQALDDDGAVWFFTSAESLKVHEIEQRPQVALSYVDTRKATYVFARGTAEIVDDRAKAEELWTSFAKAWFEGPEDPDLVLVRVQVEEAEYWNDPAGGLVSILRVGAKALGADVSQGEMGHLEP
jgi:general stress protein 26